MVYINNNVFIQTQLNSLHYLDKYPFEEITNEQNLILTIMIKKSLYLLTIIINKEESVFIFSREHVHQQFLWTFMMRTFVMSIQVIFIVPKYILSFSPLVTDMQYFPMMKALLLNIKLQRKKYSLGRQYQLDQKINDFFNSYNSLQAAQCVYVFTQL